MICGPLGIGKTTLLDRAIAAHRRRSSGRIVRLRGRVRDRPYGTLQPVLSVEAEPVASEWQFVQQVRRAIVAPTDAAPTLIVVDDLHTVDPASLVALVSFVEDDGCGFLAATEPPAPEMLPGDVERIDLAPLAADDVEQLVRGCIGDLDARSLDVLRQRAAGNPLVLRELINAASEEGRFSERDGVHTVDLSSISVATVERIVRRRRPQLSAAADATLDVLSFTSTLSSEHFDRAALTELRDRGWLPDDGLLPLLPVDLVRTTSTRTERDVARLALDAARRGANPGPRTDIVRWELLAGLDVADDQLLAAAREAAARWQLSEARELLTAVRVPSIESRVAVADLDARDGDVDRARGSLVDIATQADRDDEAVQALNALGDVIAFRLRDPAAALSAVRSMAAHVRGPSSVVSIAATELMLAQLTGDLARVGETRQRVERLVVDVFDDADRRSRAMYVANTDYFDVMRGALDDRADVAEAITTLNELALREPTTAIAGARTRLLLSEHLRRLHRGELVSAATIVHAELAKSPSGAAPRGAWLMTNADVQRLEGRLTEARRSLVSALEYLAIDDELAITDIARADLAGVLAELGERERAAQLLAELAGIQDPRAIAKAAKAQVRLAVTTHDPAIADGSAVETADAVAAAGFVVWAADVLYEAIRVGPAPASVDALTTLGAAGRNRLLDAMLMLGDATLARDAPRCHAAAADLFEMGYAAFAADALALATDVAAVNGRPFHSPLTERARNAARELTRTRQRLGADGATPADLLSLREREVAELASSGLGSKHIASQLGISPRTVDNHLGSVFRKLGIASRRELAERLS